MIKRLTSFSRRDALLALAALGAGAAGLSSPAARAQSDRPIRFILPVASGSGVDTITRAASQAVSKALGHPVVVENQPGAGGVIGTHAMIKSPPDGFTLSVVSNNHVIYPSVLKSVPFDPVNDITAITVMGTTPLVLVVNPKVPATNAKELIALLKTKPDSLNYASSGNGTILHLAAEMFMDEAGVKAKHIPYKGVGPMLTDLIGGQVEIGVLALPSVQAHLKSGALRAIGTSSAQRIAAAPEVPTFAEQGLPKYVVEGWFAVVGPKGLPAADVKRIHAAFTSAFNSPEVKEAMAKQGNTISMTSPEAAQAFFRTELGKYAALVKKAGLEPQ
ncbi:Bug family tripartite tricarboxylate transporter substrate binding protein [Caenimonas soli]|uniref:Bug family tripartite tricarboxylate transporter substrate binding protein n=1 Tax=Caenimonas soli TaxID=2735555 RepID=UPI001555B8A6|nr:tripartite tricarboxylate transporter substrate binding protein [Caenimonas soli]NPC58961.1 tripartite tricarboxylate transporter substrate binding protein [Caenimonas soli]